MGNTDGVHLLPSNYNGLFTFIVITRASTMYTEELHDFHLVFGYSSYVYKQKKAKLATAFITEMVMDYIYNIRKSQHHVAIQKSYMTFISCTCVTIVAMYIYKQKKSKVGYHFYHGDGLCI